ncbi:hypothetical protein [uncultured Dokdonia sp.]|uniref:hypothetical protein n=1 Tax=uncultured Dokdonia sp. TaxID=575653 RepID=UPI002627A6CB|nr:hypothetical protein [uncultured Dokdonia sp.]
MKTPEASLDKTVLSEHEVEFLNSTLWLPPNYQKLTYEELFEIAKVTDDALVNMLLQSAKEYRDQEQKPVFFRDEFLYGNFIVVYPMSYQRLDKRSASYWISSYDASLKMQDAQYGTTSEIVEKRIKRFGSHQMIKLKVEETRAFNENRNFTQYYISGNTHSFMVIHIDVLSSDYELNFKELSLGSK